MAIRHIREAFDQEAGDAAQCQEAFLDYVRVLDGQKQVITMKVVTADGEKHTLQTPIHEMSDDPHLHVRQRAKDFVAERAKAPRRALPPAAVEPVTGRGAISAPVTDPTPPEAGPNPRPVTPRRDGGSAGGQLRNPFID